MDKAEMATDQKTKIDTSDHTPATVSHKVKPKTSKSKMSCGKHAKSKKIHKKKQKSKAKKVESSSDDDSSSDESSSDSTSSSESESERRKKQKSKAKRKRRGRQVLVESTSDSSESEDSSSEEEAKETKKTTKTAKKSKTKNKAKSDAEPEAETATPAAEPNDTRLKTIEAKLTQLALNVTGNSMEKRRARKALRDGDTPADEDASPAKKAKRASKVAFKRVDQLWDATIHNFKLTETQDDPDADEFDQYIFTVRRQFDWEHKYEATFVDVRSTPLKEALKHAMRDVQGLTFVQDTPCLDPQMLFLFLDEFKRYIKELKSSSKNDKKKKVRAMAAAQAQHLKVLVKYLDKDFAATKKSLYPLLENDMITFDLLWALFKPNTVVYSSTYGDSDQPRAFKLETASKVQTLMHGTWYNIEGRYLEYDGKTFGMGRTAAKVDSFKGSRKISSLACYPIKYHRNLEKVKAQLIDRGKKFVALDGMNYRAHQGMAYTKKKQQVLRININGRIMIDPAVFRRINPNYQVSMVKPKVEEDYFEMTDEDDSTCDCCQSECDDHEEEMQDLDEEKPRKKYREVEREDGSHEVVEVKSDDEDLAHNEKLEPRGKKAFTDEELLISSPVVLGFAFNEKLWLEFSVSGIKEVEWNLAAFESLVLPASHKSIVKSLVTSHKFSAAKNIDDVIAGKGKGLVAVLHGPPGTGKTLTAEGIAELLKCPLYMVSAGELGTDPRTLERGLQEILDIAHAWGAVLLLDEADVFLEQRSIHDIHRNALVSIFLRLLEYFQGILFLTTNRVETFDDAFQSRIHVALKYTELPQAARLTVWRQFIGRVRALPNAKVAPFSDADYESLSRHPLNGRQIKNATRAAQALALTEGSDLKMSHLTTVLGVARSFERDLKGGSGYEDAMRSYN